MSIALPSACRVQIPEMIGEVGPWPASLQMMQSLVT
jgi:hypothetical protein